MGTTARAHGTRSRVTGNPEVIRSSSRLINERASLLRISSPVLLAVRASGLSADCGHLWRSVDLVASLLVNLAFCRIRSWYLVAPGFGISRETGRIFLWNLTLLCWLVDVIPFVEFLQFAEQKYPGQNLVTNYRHASSPIAGAQTGNVTDICTNPECTATQPIKSTSQLRVPGRALGDFFLGSRHPR